MNEATIIDFTGRDAVTDPLSDLFSQGGSGIAGDCTVPTVVDTEKLSRQAPSQTILDTLA